MGMFDYVKFEAPCLLCKRPIRHESSGAYEWQTKSAKDDESLLRSLELDEVRENFYAICPHCGVWNEYDMTSDTPRLKAQEELYDYERISDEERAKAEAIIKGPNS